ncbi:MAG: M48 family metallopeptidase [Halobacteriota archaeon]|uniref:M48 family metallopeptidase n=1 Tax=Natronomonas sp. TaxID=2184060 RepID=UPI003976B20E
MRRLPLRILMGLAGLGLVLMYALVAVVGYSVLGSLVEIPLNPVRIAVYFVVVTTVVGYLSYRLGTAGVLRDLDVVAIERFDAAGLYARLDRISSSFDVDGVTLYAARMGEPNALAVGAARGGAVVIDVGLLRLLSTAELEAIIAHELAHLENRDGLIQTLGYTMVRTIGGMFYLVLLPIGLLVGGIVRASAWLRGEYPRPLAAHFATIQWRVAQAVVVLLFALTLALRAHSRRREYAADDRAVEATGDPIALARALVKIKRAATPRWGLLSPLYVHGDEEGILSRLLATHPPMDERIERLVRRANEPPEGASRRSRGNETTAPY